MCDILPSQRSSEEWLKQYPSSSQQQQARYNPLCGEEGIDELTGSFLDPASELSNYDNLYSATSRYGVPTKSEQQYGTCSKWCSSPLCVSYWWPVSLLITAACCTGHWLFWQGQHLPVYHYEIVASVRNASINGDFIVPIHYTLPPVDESLNLDTYSYMQTLNLLHNIAPSVPAFWTKVNNASITDPNYYVNTEGLSVVYWLLLILSGFWPHVKLLLIHLLWYIPFNGKARTRALWWADFLGRTTMFDLALAMQQFVYASITLPPTPIKAMLDNTLKDLPDFIFNSTRPEVIANSICTGKVGKVPKQYQGMLCSDGGIIPMIFSKHSVMTDFMAQAHLQATGYLEFTFHVVADEGCYFFSTAVWLTLLASAIIGILDWLATEKHKDWASQGGNSAVSLLTRSGMGLKRRVGVVLLLVCSAATLGCGMLFRSTSTRMVGSFRSLLNVILGGWTNSLSWSTSLWDATLDVGNVGKAGDDSVNLFLQKDLFLFMVFAPTMMLALSVVVLLIPMKFQNQTRVAFVIGVLCSFCGWEMFVLASIALSWCLPSFTVSIFWSDWDLNKYGLWNVCKLTEDSFLTGDRVCFELQTNIIWEGFAFICVGALLLYGVRMCVSMVHRRALSMEEANSALGGGIVYRPIDSAKTQE